MKFTVVKFSGKLHQNSGGSTAILKFLRITKEPQNKGTLLYHVCTITVIGKEKMHRKADIQSMINIEAYNFFWKR